MKKCSTTKPQQNFRLKPIKCFHTKLALNLNFKTFHTKGKLFMRRSSSLVKWKIWIFYSWQTLTSFYCKLCKIIRNICILQRNEFLDTLYDSTGPDIEEQYTCFPWQMVIHIFQHWTDLSKAKMLLELSEIYISQFSRSSNFHFV